MACLPEVLLPTIAKGSGDSFVLRNHGMKSMLPRDFPERAFSTRYAIKDLSYALEMAEASGLDVAGAELTMQRLKQTEAGRDTASQYHPVVLNVIDPTMSIFPDAAPGARRVPRTPSLAAWAGPWSVCFAIESGGGTTDVRFRRRAGPAGGGDPAFTLAAPDAVWAKFLPPVPPRHHHGDLRDD